MMIYLTVVSSRFLVFSCFEIFINGCDKTIIIFRSNQFEEKFFNSLCEFFMHVCPLHDFGKLTNVAHSGFESFDAKR